MSSPELPSRTLSPVRSSRARRAISAVFLVNGLMLASWISRIPRIADDLHLSSGEVGTALMAMAAGAIVAFPLAGRIIDVRSSAMATVGFVAIIILALPLVGLTPNLPMLMVAFFCFGAGNGGMDVSMNAQGVEVEKVYGSNIINSLHGFFSLGAFLGAGIGATAARLEIGPAAHFSVVVLIALVVVAWARQWFVADAVDVRATSEPTPVFSLPPRPIWGIGALAFCASVGEGAIGDWSGLYLHEELGTSTAFAALGYAAFSVSMLVARFSGDAIVARVSPVRLIRAGGVIAAVGLGIAVIVNVPVTLVIGFAAVGLGLAVIYPLVFSAAGNHATLARGRAVAGVATVGYTGFLAGPPLLGWVADFTSLRVTMVLVVLLAALVAAMAGAIRTDDPVASGQMAESLPEADPALL